MYSVVVPDCLYILTRHLPVYLAGREEPGPRRIHFPTAATPTTDGLLTQLKLSHPKRPKQDL